MKTDHLSPYPGLSEALHGFTLRGKSVLITGGGYGIGADIAKSFASRGVSEIILVGRQETKLKATASSLGSFKDTKVIYRTTDISSKHDVEHLFDNINGIPDFLVNNAGYLPEPTAFVDADLDEWWKGFTVNVLGTVMVTQTFLRHRRASHSSSGLDPAVVITLNTIGALSIRVPKLSAYGASKAGLARWSELMAADVPETEARFVSVHPGFVQTNMADKSGLAGIFPPTEGKLVGDFITWLTSRDASFLAGRFVWASWDVQDLLEKKEEIVSRDLYVTALSQ